MLADRRRTAGLRVDRYPRPPRVWSASIALASWLRNCPAVGLTGTAAKRGVTAVERQVAELQAGLGDGDAKTYNRHFATT